jgi:hypothetical protein
MKFKMAATAGLILTLEPIGKMFQNASSLKPLGQLKPNCPGMIIGRSSVFFADRKSKMAATTGHSNNTGPYGENTEIYINHWKVLYKLCVFYVDRNSKMTTTAGHSFYIGPIGSFYNQVNDTGS